LVVMGSNGEAAHLLEDEGAIAIKAYRNGLDEADFRHVPIIAGASRGSVRGTLAAIEEYKAAGADYVILLPPSYFRALVDEETIYNYFINVAEKTPLKIILYNYPGAVAGIDMDSDLLIRLAKHENIIGTKFTCANTGKLTRVALATNAATPSSQNSGYFAFGGMADFTLQTFMSNGSGIIAGGANVMPKVCVKVWNLCSEGKYDEARELQQKLSKADWILTKAAIAGTKAAIEHHYGYGGHPRRPLKKLDKIGVTRITDGLQDILAIEKQL